MLNENMKDYFVLNVCVGLTLQSQCIDLFLLCA